MANSLLCETVTGRTMTELLAARDAVRDADMVELRVDGVSDLDVPGALAGRRRAALVTCRAAWEGGRFDGSEEERKRLLTQALAAGAELVDVEWRAGFEDLVRAHAQRIVLSFHDFEGAPRDLADRARAMRGAGASVVKLAVAVTTLSETLRLRDLARDGDAVVIGMGESGVPTRLLAAHYGSRWTYAGHGVAPGQIPASRMVSEFRFRDVGPRTQVFGVVSTKAMHSLSPAMHNAAFSAAGIDAVYVPLRAADFADFLAYAESLPVAGVSVTIPFKLDALSAATEADERTRTVGAANTLRRSRAGGATPGDGRAPRSDEAVPERWEATNTDLDGFLEPLIQRWAEDLRGARASVLGAGGAARAVVVALLSRGAHVTVHARRPEQAADLARALGTGAGSWPPDASSWDLLVNCTPLGGADERGMSPVPAMALGPADTDADAATRRTATVAGAGARAASRRLVYDLTYGPGDSALLRDARKAGCVTIDGLPMLVAQAERQFEWWTGRRPQSGVMLEAARRKLALDHTDAGGPENGAEYAPGATGPNTSVRPRAGGEVR